MQSVINQTFREFEVILVNDGSTDDSMVKVIKMIERQSEQVGERVHEKATERGNDDAMGRFWIQLLSNPKDRERGIQITLINQGNYGVSTARNNGVKMAKYDYIAFLDADDWWDIRFLEEMKVLIDNFPDAGLFGCNYFSVKNRKTSLGNKGFHEGFNKGYIDYIKTYRSTYSVPLNCSFVVVTKKTFSESGGFNPDLKYGEDFDLWIRLAIKKEVAYLNKPLAWSNQDAEQSTRAVGNSHLYPPKNHYIFNLDYLSKDELSNPELKYLLDGLRVRSLLKYHIHKRFPAEVKNELAKVNLNKQPFYFRFIYKSPKFLVHIYFFFRRSGAAIKQLLLTKI